MKKLSFSFVCEIWLVIDLLLVLSGWGALMCRYTPWHLTKDPLFCIGFFFFYRMPLIHIMSYMYIIYHIISYHIISYHIIYHINSQLYTHWPIIFAFLMKICRWYHQIYVNRENLKKKKIVKIAQIFFCNNFTHNDPLFWFATYPLSCKNIFTDNALILCVGRPLYCM